MCLHLFIRNPQNLYVFTYVHQEIIKNLYVFTWFWKVMLLTMVFGLFFIGFLMDFHGEGFCKAPYSSQ